MNKSVRIITDLGGSKIALINEDMATVYSANPAWIRKMDALVHEFPDVFRIKRWTEISKTYEMPKKYIRIGKPRELSPVQTENLEKMRDVRISKKK